jgi:hypothetical protein
MTRRRTYDQANSSWAPFSQWVQHGYSDGGGRAGSAAAQGSLFTEVEHPEKG